jgi:hypothetical protein
MVTVETGYNPDGDGSDEEATHNNSMCHDGTVGYLSASICFGASLVADRR